MGKNIKFGRGEGNIKGVVRVSREIGRNIFFPFNIKAVEKNIKLVKREGGIGNFGNQDKKGGGEENIRMYGTIYTPVFFIFLFPTQFLIFGRNPYTILD